jgi:hypothetical protein
MCKNPPSETLVGKETLGGLCLQPCFDSWGSGNKEADNGNKGKVALFSILRTKRKKEGHVNRDGKTM